MSGEPPAWPGRFSGQGMAAAASASHRAHALAPGALLRLLGSRPDGLTSAEAAERRARVGANTLREQPGVPAWRLARDQVLNPLVLILLGAVAVLVVVSVADPAESEWGDAVLILAIVVLNGVLGFAQNYRAQRGIEALRRLEVPEVRVLRDGSPAALPATSLVPGVVVLLEEGDRIPADGRLLAAHGLWADESSLTGESAPSEKGVDAVPEDAPLAERSDMVYLGTAAVAGRGRAVVTSTGMATEVGAIAEAVQAVREGPTPFQREVAGLGQRITAVIGVLIVLIAALQLTIGGLGLLDTFIAAVALAVAAIPEGLPVVMTLALAFATRRMLERHALVRSLPLVEIVGGAEVICTDKTGTITEGRMSLRRLHTPGLTVDVDDESPSAPFLAGQSSVDLRGSLALLASGLCNNAHRRDDGTFLGDPTEVALLKGALLGGIDLTAWERTEELPFSSERKRMSVVVRGADGSRVLCKGAPEVILERCTWVLGGAGVAPMTPEARAEIVLEQQRLAGQAFRVLALAGKDGQPDGRETIERSSSSTRSPPSPIPRGLLPGPPSVLRPRPASGW